MRAEEHAEWKVQADQIKADYALKRAAAATAGGSGEAKGAPLVVIPDEVRLRSFLTRGLAWHVVLARGVASNERRLIKEDDPRRCSQTPRETSLSLEKQKLPLPRRGHLSFCSLCKMVERQRVLIPGKMAPHWQHGTTH